MSRPFSAARLRASASFVRLTGVSVTTFDGMLKQLVVPWEKVQLRKAKPGRPWDVGGLEDHLLIMLIYYRCYIIPRSADNPEFRWVYDTEVIRDLIAPLAPVRWHVLAQKGQHRAAELLEGGVALIVSGVSVHQAP